MSPAILDLRPVQVRVSFPTPRKPYSLPECLCLSSLRVPPLSCVGRRLNMLPYPSKCIMIPSPISLQLLAQPPSVSQPEQWVMLFPRHIYPSLSTYSMGSSVCLPPRLYHQLCFLLGCQQLLRRCVSKTSYGIPRTHFICWTLLPLRPWLLLTSVKMQKPS